MLYHVYIKRLTKPFFVKPMLGIETAFRDELNRFIFVKWVKMGKMGRMGKIGNTPDWSSNNPLDKI